MGDNIVVSLEAVAEELEMLSDDWQQFYNRESGEFMSYHPDFSEDEIEPEVFEAEEYDPLPSQRDLHEYDLMAEFAETVRNAHTRELLEVALNGRGAFRRFKNVVNRTGMEDAWYGYRKKALLEIAREWCAENDIVYK